MAHAQKPNFVFRRNGRVHLNRLGSQFSQLLAAEVCASALVMLDTPRSEVVWEYWLPTPFTSFPFTSPPVRYRVPPHSERSLQPNSVLISVLKLLSVGVHEQPSVFTSFENGVTHCIFDICQTVCSWPEPLKKCNCPWSDMSVCALIQVEDFWKTFLWTVTW
jgi:hypothetical protein